MKKVAVIGAGNLGSRHLQALAKVNSIKEIYIIDPSEEALNKANQLYKEISWENEKKIHQLNSLLELQTSLDFAVIATGSKQRRKVIEELLTRVNVKYLLLEKFLFPALEDYNSITALLKEKGVKAWVNCPRRMYPYYQQMRDSINPNDPIVMFANASNLMVGTHAVHFLDLFCFLIQSSDIDEVRSEGLHPVAYKSKRPGYIEFKGNLVFRSGPHIMVFQTFEKEILPLQVTITQPHIRYNVLEHNSKVLVSSASNDWSWETFPFPKPFQSELTNIVAESLAQNGACDLTSYEESAKIHRSLLQPLLEFMQTKLKISTDHCNIT